MSDPFTTERLRLRAFEPEDLSALHAYLNYPELSGRRCLPWRFPNEQPLSRAQVEQVLQRWAEGEKEFHLAVTLREDGSLIGHANCDWGWDAHCPEIDLAISPAYQFQGYGSEVLDILLAYLFENTPAHSISSGMASWNWEALNFALKHGFAQNGSMRRAGLWDGRFYDWLGVDILRPEWLARSRKGGA
jgi:RimJ/RimL family protein N-acetyltransferase